MFKDLTETDIKLVIAFAHNNMNVTETSRQEYLHRNTIDYHLKKVKRVTGLDPYNFYELIQLMELAGVITLQCKYFKK